MSYDDSDNGGYSTSEDSGSELGNSPESNDGLESLFRSVPKRTRLTSVISRKSSGPSHCTQTQATKARLPLPPRTSTHSVKHSSRSKVVHSSSTSFQSPRLPPRENALQKSPATPLSRQVARSHGSLLTSPQAHYQASPDITPLVAGQTTDTGSVVTALKDVTSLLNTLIRRVEDNSKDIKSLKLSMSQSSSGSSSSDTPKKRKVPAVVRKETRRMYTMLRDEDEDFGFVIGPDVTFTTEINGSVASRVIKEVKGQNPEFQTCDIRESIYTYYKSLCQERSAERRGLKEIRQKNRKLRERITRKLQERKVTLQRSTLSSQDKRQWNEVMVYDMMSSEEDASEDDCIIVRPLSWRSQATNDFFKALDDQARTLKSSQALRQMKRRVVGPTSERPRIECSTIPKWAFVASDPDSANF